jgi:hypothetical protein
MSQVRVGNNVVPRTELLGGQIHQDDGNKKCEQDVDGTAGGLGQGATYCKNRPGRYVTLQWKAGAGKLAIRHIAIAGNLDPPCSAPVPP